MIEFNNKIFHLETETTSYCFRITDKGHLEHIYYGARILSGDFMAILPKRSAMIGSSVAYDDLDPMYCLDNILLEYSGIGKGDYRHSPLEIKHADGFVTDFVFDTHKIYRGTQQLSTLPTAIGAEEDCTTLKIVLNDKPTGLILEMYYTVFYSADCITRKCVLKNQGKNSISVRKIMSYMVDLPSCNYNMISFDGGWIKEAHKHTSPLSYGIYINSSTTGNSSNRHNAGIIISSKNAAEDYGECYGFNLIYSGNHYTALEVSNHETLRVMGGINPHCFDWDLKPEENFETPEAVLCYSSGGFNGLSDKFHRFTENHIVRGPHAKSERPVLFNNWEATFFKFNQRKILKMAGKAAKLGAELIVLDDGWFGKRNSDRAGLGDYEVNRKKLPGGLSKLSKKIEKSGCKFGLWFEPEMVNPDSNLYREHPDYSVKAPERSPSLGRNQLVLDLCRKDVRDYIVQNICKVLSSAKISYIKWDMNRHISDMYSLSLSNQGEFFHRYILGLYDIFSQIVKLFPEILIESCSSGGNRFDLGMLCFTPQIWASDNTDPVERLKIQEGLSYLYPTSTMGAHVSASPHQQTLRNTPLSTRYNVAAFGLLGYELDLNHLTKAEKKEIAAQIAQYKKWRQVLQYGRFFRYDKEKPNRVNWCKTARDKTAAVFGNFQTYCSASPGNDIVKVKGLNKLQTYNFETAPQGISIKRFGGLINHISPVRLHPEGFIIRLVNKHYQLPDCVESYKVHGDVLEAGVKLNNQFMGTYYNNQTRLLGDFGSNLYFIKNISAKEAVATK